MIKYCVFVLILCVSVVWSFGQVHAQQTRFNQAIVPLECYIDAVNSGTGSHLYITPEDCFEELPQLIQTPTSNDRQQPTQISSEDRFYTPNPNNPDSPIQTKPNLSPKPIRDNSSSIALPIIGAVQEMTIQTLLVLSIVLLSAIPIRWYWLKRTSK